MGKVWEFLAASVNPLTAYLDNPPAVVTQHELALVAYNEKAGGARRLAAFDLRSGARRWDIELPEDIAVINAMVATPTHVYLTFLEVLYAYDVRTGKLVFESR